MYYTVDKQEMKRVNTLAILNVIRRHGPLSKADIARILLLNPATVSSNLMVLEKQGLVRKVREGPSTGGRKPVLIDLDEDHIRIVTICMARSGMAIGCMDMKGRMHYEQTLNYTKGRQLWAILDVLGEVVNEYKAHAQKNGCVLLGVGCVLDGLVDGDTGQVRHSRDFQWREVTLGKILEEKFGLPVFLSDLGSAMAVAEHYFGAGEDCDNFVHVHIGEGIYTGVYIQGKLYSGFNYGACNVAHHKVSSTNIKCFCGKSGCFEVMASYSGIVTRFINRLEEADINKLLKDVQYDLSHVNADMIYTLAIEGDNLAQQIIRDTGRYIGRGLGAIVNMINPEKIFISGVYNAHNIMNRNINKHLAHSSIDRNLYQVQVGESGISNSLFLAGAGAVFMDRLMNGFLFKSHERHIV